MRIQGLMFILRLLKLYERLIKTLLDVANALVPVTADMNIKVQVNLKLQRRRHPGTLIFNSIHQISVMVLFYVEN